jgi:hypothetical protein
VKEPRKEYAGLLVCLAKQEWPDLDDYNDPEVYWRLKKEYHAGIIVRSPKAERVEELTNAYMTRFYADFFTSLPPTEKAVD